MVGRCQGVQTWRSRQKGKGVGQVPRCRGVGGYGAQEQDGKQQKEQVLGGQVAGCKGQGSGHLNPPPTTYPATAA